MPSKCANPACSNAFLYLHEGKLFLLNFCSNFARRKRSYEPVDRPSSPQYAWLCSSCCRSLTIRIDQELGAMVVRQVELPSDGALPE